MASANYEGWEATYRGLPCYIGTCYAPSGCKHDIPKVENYAMKRRDSARVHTKIHTRIITLAKYIDISLAS